jgi:hypothetical protein
MKNNYNIVDILGALAVGIATTKAIYNETFCKENFPIAFVILTISIMSNQMYKHTNNIKR